MTVPGLPESIELAEYRLATADDYISVRGGVQAGPSSFPTFILRPAEGFEFRYDIASDSYQPATKAAKIPEVAKPELMAFQAACDLLLKGKTKKIARAVWNNVWLENRDDGTPLFVQVTGNGKEPSAPRIEQTWAHNKPDMAARDWKVIE
jgi:hypothetical protein